MGDPATGLPIGDTKLNLKAAIAGETHEYTDMYPGMAKSAREEGFAEIADWFETLAKAERSHANRFQKALDDLSTVIDRDAAEDPAAAGLDAPLVMADVDEHEARSPTLRTAAAKAVSRPPPAIRSTGGTRPSTTRRRSPRSWSASSTSATAAAAASACATRSRHCSMPSTPPPTVELDGVDKKVFWQVVDHCYLCDMCYMTKCPYVPPHPWNVDFPHLMLRAKAVRDQQGGRRASAIARWPRPTPSDRSPAFRWSRRSSTPSTARASAREAAGEDARCRPRRAGAASSTPARRASACAA